MGKCTCHMDGSYMTSCPLHGEYWTLRRAAERKVGNMSIVALRAFLKPKSAFVKPKKKG